jgi:anti-anti-sigma regulatory factor
MSENQEKAVGNGSVVGTYLMVMIVLAVGTIMAVGMYLLASSWESTATEHDFDVVCGIRSANYQRKIEDISTRVFGYKAYYASSKHVDLSEFITYSRMATSGHDGLIASAWLPRIKESERVEFEKVQAPKDGVDGFRIDRKGTTRPDYFPVLYVDPPGNGELVVGDDLYAVPSLRKAMNKARDGGDFVEVTPYSRTGKKGVFLMIAPVYKNGKPSGTVAERRENILGYIIRAHDIVSVVQKTLVDGESEATGIDFTMSMDVNGADYVFLDHKSRSGGDVSTSLKENVKTFTVGSETFKVVSRATGKFVDDRETAQPATMGTIIFVATLLVAIVIFRVIESGKNVAALAKELEGSHAQLEKRVDERTAELVARNEEMERQAVEIQQANDSIREQAMAITELSTPVIRVWSGIVLLPMIGTVDTARSQQMTDRLLDAIATDDSKVAILDVTGVPTIDTSVARHIMTMVAAANVLGAEVVITGFSPEAAQTIAQLGVDFSQLRTAGSLQNGVTEAFSIINVKITV